MSCIKKIFLDLDGPLLDGKERHYHCYRNILERYGFMPISIDKYWESKRTLLNRRELLKMSSAEAIYDEFLAEWLAMIETPYMLALDKVQEGAVDCLFSWKERGIKITLVTMRKNKDALEDQLIATGLRKFLDTVFVCDHADSGVGKADAVRDIFQNKSNQVDTLWIGDTEVDWEAAKSLGCRIVLLTNGLRSDEYLRSLEGAIVKTSMVSLKDEFNVS